MSHSVFPADRCTQMMRQAGRSRVVLVAVLLLCASRSGDAQNRNDERESRASRNARPSRNDTREVRLDTTVSVERGIIVDLSAGDGRISVRGWNRDQVEIHAVSASGELQFSRNARSLRLEASRGGRSKAGDATIMVRVPLSTRVVVGTRRGAVEVLDVLGEVDATLVSGDVTIRGASGRTAVSNVSGDIILSDIDGALRVNSISGDMSIDDVRGDVGVTSSTSDISLNRIQSNFVQVQVVQGDISYDGAVSKTGTYDFSTHSGDVHLFVPDSTAGTVNMQSFSGSLHSSIPLTLPGSNAARGAGNVRQLNGGAMRFDRQQRFEIGGGKGAQVTVVTFSGDVYINRGPRREGKDF